MNEERAQDSSSQKLGHVPPDVTKALSGVEESLDRIRVDLAAVHDADAMNRLAQDLESIKKYTNALRNGVPTWWRLSVSKDTLTIALSLVAVLLSAFSLYRTFFLSPDIRLTVGSEIDLSFDPKTNQLEVGFRSVLANYGGRMDVLRVAQGTLSWEQTQGRQPIIFPSGSLSFSAGGRQLSLPLAAKENSAVELDIKAARVLGTGLRNRFFDSSTFATAGMTRKHEFELEFRSETEGSSTVESCFEFTKEILLDLSQGKPVNPVLTSC